MRFWSARGGEKSFLSRIPTRARLRRPCDRDGAITEWIVGIKPANRNPIFSSLTQYIMKTAVLHDWLLTYAGADRVLEQILTCCPDADLFSLVNFLPSEQRTFIQNKEVHTTFVQHLPLAQKWFRKCLPLLPFAVEQFDFSP